MLDSAGIDSALVRLLRHQRAPLNGATPYTLWRDERSLFDAYQATQQVKNRARFTAPYWASFVVTPNGQTLFAGLYAVGEPGTVPTSWPYPLSKAPAGGGDEVYSTRHLDDLADYEGRLAIEWGAGTRTWVQRADQQDKPIEELTRRFAEPPFPGFGAFVEPLSRILALPSSWTEALRAARGIYLLTCPITKELYVGSAIGSDGFLGRWHHYAVDGHGGNVMLRSRERSDYQVSILEVAGSLDSDADVLALESRWKGKLQSRAMGLNAN
ncbi:GIY-YIG nuclease family protein [Sphingomonas sp. GC_Shp_2]|uniref:GIY-YIG nuclease family protein n=1 Tax=Sphingomonas sp. GC_Shp_2 TaxID=2937384 RepID=UPI00226AA718|nr:GIY-YIG nuclease family protein [Sphingomonas sp. GC_Shp_2]